VGDLEVPIGEDESGEDEFEDDEEVAGE